jgi:hypothetical protein
VDDATRAVMPPDPEMIQVGDAIWQRPQWRGLVQGSVGPVGARHNDGRELPAAPTTGGDTMSGRNDDLPDILGYAYDAFEVIRRLARASTAARRRRPIGPR